MANIFIGTALTIISLPFKTIILAVLEVFLVPLFLFFGLSQKKGNYVTLANVHTNWFNLKFILFVVLV
jgi:hypothetical protein